MISILMPVWNQGSVVVQGFPQLLEVLNKTREACEVIFVDDGSQDDTFLELAEAQKNFPLANIKIIRTKHLGQHVALLEGFKIAAGDLIITMDADQKVSSEYIPELIERLKKGHDMVVAWRHERPGIGLARSFGSRAINSWTNFVTGKRLHDHSCSLKGYSAELVKSNLSRPGLSRFFGILVAKYAHNPSEIKVECRYKEQKDSSLGLWLLAILFFDFFLYSFFAIRRGDDR